MNCIFRGLCLRHVMRATPAVLLILTGCAVPPSIQDPFLALPETELYSRTASLANQHSLSEATVPSEWWKLFSDPTLTELQANALELNLDLQAAATRIEESRAQLGLANAARRPEIAANAAYSRSALSEHSPMALLGAPTEGADLWSLGLQAKWELDLWGYLRARSASSRAKLEATGYDMEAARLSVAGDVARTYLLLRGVQAQEAITLENRQLADGLVRMAQSRLRNGVATHFDEAAARADVAAIDARLSLLHHQRSTLTNALALLLSKPPRELDRRLSTGSLPPMPQRLPIGVPSELARQRPDILQAEARLRAAVADIGAAKADFYPRISLTGSIGLEAMDLSDLGNWGSRRYSLGPTLHLPIFQHGRLESNLALSEARHRLAGIAFQQTVLRAWHEVDDALSAYTTELKRHEHLQVALTQNQTALAVAQRAYQEGLSDFTSVLVARRSLLASQAELSDCATAAALTVVSLYRALGGGWSAQLRVEVTPVEAAS